MELQIKTACARGSASNEQLLFTFSQNGKSCRTGIIPPQTRKCGHNEYEGNQLGQCVNFKFSHDQTVEGTVTYKNKRSRDGWTPEWAKLFLKDGNIMKCQFLGGLSGNAKFLNFICNVESKFLRLLGGQNYYICGQNLKYAKEIIVFCEDLMPGHTACIGF